MNNLMPVKKNIVKVSDKVQPIMITQQTGLECAYATITNILTLLNSGILKQVVGRKIEQMKKESVCLILSYYII